jgi:hypothetical protein
MDDETPSFLRPIPQLGRIEPALELSPQARRDLDERLKEFARARAEAVRNAHRYWVL